MVKDLKQEIKESIEIKAPIVDALKTAYENPTYQFHIPGHTKGKAIFKGFKKLTGEKVLNIDTTDEFDNLGTLHPATGPIKEAQELAAEAFGAKHLLKKGRKLLLTETATALYLQA